MTAEPVQSPAAPFPSLTATSEAERLTLLGLAGAARASALAELALRDPRPLVLVTPDARESEVLRQDLAFFLGRLGEGRASPRVVSFPAWDPLPDDRLSPPGDVTQQRLEALARILLGGPFLLIVPVGALFQKVAPREVFLRYCQRLAPGQTRHWDNLRKTLIEAGYTRLDRVENPGEMAVRGGLLDAFPPGADAPVRVELLGPIIESVRTFDPETQRSTGDLSEALLIPCREIVYSDETVERAIAGIRARAEEIEFPRLRREAIVERVRNRLHFPGVESLQPLFFERIEPLVSTLPPDARYVFTDLGRIERAWEDLREALARWERDAEQAARFFLPAFRFFDLEASPAALARRPGAAQLGGLDEQGAEAPRTLRFATESNEDLKAALGAAPPKERGLKPFVERVRRWLADGMGVFVVASRNGQAERIRGLLADYDVPAEVDPDGALPLLAEPAFQDPRRACVRVVVGRLSAGYRSPATGQVVLTDEELFGAKVHRASSRQSAASRFESLSLWDLKEGQPLVHADFGVGLYRGLRQIKVADRLGDFLHLEYAGGDRLYLPIDQINLVQCYIGADDSKPALNQLGGTRWAHTKKRVKDSILEMADELAKIYAARKAARGFAFSKPDRAFEEFSAAFPYDETPDQLRAIEEVLSDMEAERPMDRLVCGDVGYGKTEVAMRAAFRAAMDGKQVAILVPTTLLAEQHFDSFTERFRSTPVRIEMLTRFRDRAEQKKIIADTAAGRVDILIGTHRLLQNDLVFRDLGLVIVDEEHRFGVVHKEKLKKLRTEVDFMTLTATPIPRTLHMSLSGIRDLSLIHTPPQDRQAVRTYVVRFDRALIREAILREIGRGGEVFFVHNRVASIGATARMLSALVPEARVSVAHGQMDAKTLEKVMRSFVHKETNVLVCTAIIESGLDIPTANTMLINRADRFGLAQLYQLRGRVGRGKERAFAYLLVPEARALTDDAEKRLEAIREMADLGSGFRLALHDLEIRGAGNLLGRAQSGQIAAIGFELYNQLVEEALAQIRGEEPPSRVEPELHMRVEAFIPQEYIPDTNERLLAYRQIAAAANEEELGEIRWEWIDRFGRLPPKVEGLFQVVDLKIRMRRLKVRVARQDRRSVTLHFDESNRLDPAKLLALSRRDAGKVRLYPDRKISLALGVDASWEIAHKETRALLAALEHCIETGGEPHS